jgi:hypothetical protein
MNYQKIAEIVHDFVKTPKSMLSQEPGLPWREIKTHELTIIQTVFSKYELSGAALAVGVRPQSFWG